METGELFTSSEIAHATGVTLAAVSNWRRRHSSFPAPHEGTGDSFPIELVAEWLDGRRIAASGLKHGEPPGFTYGDRLRRNLSSSRPVAPRIEQLWRVIESLRAVADVAVLADAVLGLLWLCAEEPSTWHVVARAGDDREIAQLCSVWASRQRESPFIAQATVTISSGSRGQLVELVQLIDQGWRSEDGGSRRWVATAFERLYAPLAEAEGRRTSEFFTPSSLVQLMTELVAPGNGNRVLDPCCGGGQFLVSAAAYVTKTHGAQTILGLAGQTIGERLLRLASLNLGVHGYRAELQHGLALTQNLHAGQKFDVVLTNPPFNLSIDDSYPDDARWRFGNPSPTNANFAWLQHAVASLASGGRAAVAMANSAANSLNRQDALTRRAMVDAGVVEALVAMPPGLFATTAIPITVWVLRHPDGGQRGEVLFIDAIQRGKRLGRARRILTPEDIDWITQKYRTWRDGEFRAERGFAASVTIDDIALRQYRLAPSTYVGVESMTKPAVDDIHELWSELMRLGDRAAIVDSDLHEKLTRALR